MLFPSSKLGKSESDKIGTWKTFKNCGGSVGESGPAQFSSVNPLATSAAIATAASVTSITSGNPSETKTLTNHTPRSIITL